MADEKYHLVVTRPFHNPQTNQLARVSDRITDADAVARILDSHHSTFVVKVPVQEDWQPKQDKPPAAETGKPAAAPGKGA